jgi:cyclohexanecarboxylate-CoA ligase
MIRPTRSIHPDFLAKDVFTRRPLGAALTDVAVAMPDGLALVEGSRRIHWRELDQRSNACARQLRSLGIGANDVVTVILPSCWEAVVAMHALLKLGAVNNPVVPIYRDAELRFILRQAGPRAVVTPHRFRGWDYVEMFERLTAEMDHPPAMLVVRPEGRLPRGFFEFEAPADAGETVESASDPSEVCLLLYTSGTTADPKGVLHNHQTLDYAARAIAERCDIRPGETIFMPSPVGHITGYLLAVLLPSMLGSPCVLMDVWNPERAREIIEAERCRFAAAATPFLKGLLDAYGAAGDASSALRSFCCGGADVPPGLIRAARERLAETTSRAYGSSELPAYCMGGPGFDERICAETDGVPITADCEARLDGAIDGVGELLIRGPQMFLGYLDGSLNQDAFTEDGFFRSGDLARIGAQGEVTIVGRKKDVILRGGENISAKQVEDALYRHPSVREVAIVAMPDPVLVERVCAFVVPAGSAAPTLAQLAAHLEAEGLAKQKWPERLEISTELPMTPSGKIQKFKLRQLIREQIEREAKG